MNIFVFFKNYSLSVVVGQPKTVKSFLEQEGSQQQFDEQVDWRIAQLQLDDP